MDNIISNALGSDGTQLVAAEKGLLMSRLLAHLAHEIRNPLSSLDVHFQLLDEDLSLADAPTREKTANRLEVIRSELHRLENTVKQFLRLAATSHLELESVELPAICQHVFHLLQPDAGARGIDLHCECEADLPPLSADSGQLTQALLNLVINALQAVSSQGRVDILARRGPEETLVVEVRDTGPGVPEAHRATIFEPYFTTKSDGTGLGLWIVHQIVAAHEGEIRVANLAKGGAAFTLKLPRQIRSTTNG